MRPKERGPGKTPSGLSARIFQTRALLAAVELAKTTPSLNFGAAFHAFVNGHFQSGYLSIAFGTVFAFIQMQRDNYTDVREMLERRLGFLLRLQEQEKRNKR